MPASDAAVHYMNQEPDLKYNVCAEERLLKNGVDKFYKKEKY